MDVFLSYDSNDEKFVRELMDRLVESGIDVVNPDLDLRPGTNWFLETGRALERSNGVVFVFSGEASPASSRKDFEYVISHPRYEGNVVSILLSRNAKIPWILREMPLVDASDRDAVRAADTVLETLAPAPRRATKRHPPRKGPRRTNAVVSPKAARVSKRH